MALFPWPLANWILGDMFLETLTEPVAVPS